MLRAIIRNRNALRGYSVVGSFLTFISLVLFEFAYHLVGNVIGFAVGWATVAFWFIAFIYTLKQKLETRKHEQKALSSSAT
jgi:TctA family transporter